MSLVQDVWLLKKRVGKGTFSELFLGKNILLRSGGQQVAVKLQNEGTEGVVVRHEGEVLRALSGVPTVPAYIHHGQMRGREFLVMDLLGGEDMSSLRDRVRKISGTHLVPLPAAAYLARQMLRCIKNIHERGFIHRDIKPANFVRRDWDSPEFCMIDFGVAKQFRDKSGALKPKRDFAEFRGTVQYASPFVHEGQDQCPRDDLFSLVLVFLDLVCGKLPWAEAYRQTKDKAAAAATKREYLDRPERMMEWVAQAVVAAERAATGAAPAPADAETAEGEEEAEPRNFPAHVRAATLALVQHLQSLEYASTPDYALLDETFRLMHPPGHAPVDDPRYSFEGFSWVGGKDNRLPEGGGDEKPAALAGGDQRLMHAVVAVRVQQLGRWVRAVRAALGGGAGAGAGAGAAATTDAVAVVAAASAASASAPAPAPAPAQSVSMSTAHSLGLRSSQPAAQLAECASLWAALCADLLALGPEGVSRELCELALGVYKDAGRFFDVDTGIGAEAGLGAGAGAGVSMKPAEWAEALRVSDRVCAQCEAVLRRPRPIEVFGSKKRGFGDI